MYNLKTIIEEKVFWQATISTVALLVLLFLKIKFLYCFAIIIIVNILVYVLEGLLKKYILNQKRKKLEHALIDDVLLLSSQPRTNDLKQIIEKLSKSKHKIISQEFKIVKKKIEDGHNVREIFQIISKKYNSEILNRFLELLSNSISSGTVSVEDYRSFASNFLKSKQLIDERASALLMQKYTIIFAGGFIVPGILGVVISLVKKLTSNLNLTMVQATLTTNQSLFTICYACSIIYLIEYIVISSIYLAMLESDIKKTIVYFVFMFPIAALIFFISPYII